LAALYVNSLLPVRLPKARGRSVNWAREFGGVPLQIAERSLDLGEVRSVFGAIGEFGLAALKGGGRQANKQRDEANKSERDRTAGRCAWGQDFIDISLARPNGTKVRKSTDFWHVTAQQSLCYIYGAASAFCCFEVYPNMQQMTEHAEPSIGNASTQPNGMLMLRREAKELHVFIALYWHRVSHALRVDALQQWSPGGPSVSVVGAVVLSASRGVVVVAKDAGPFLAGLLVVLRIQGGVGASVVNLHLGAGAVVAGVHVEDDVSPLLRRIVDLAVGAGAVPGIDTAGLRHEAASRHARIDDTGLE
jgi:hypothetical protein